MFLTGIFIAMSFSCAYCQDLTARETDIYKDLANTYIDTLSRPVPVTLLINLNRYF